VAGLKVEAWPIDRLIPYVRNPRKNDEQVDRMASAIREFGFRVPIVARSDGSVVDGHLRLKAAQKLGLKEVPVALADELTEAQVKAFRILANKSANWAEWDTDLLKLELQELQELDFDLELTGFDAEELGDIWLDGDGGDFDPDEDAEATRLDEKEKKTATCPHCGHIFELKE
jgi:ParB-like chromosome segregation protein Spo0J